MLYIFWLLHQTTTPWTSVTSPYRCISFDSYIKPQLESTISVIAKSCISFDSYIKPQLITIQGREEGVVYLLTPTSNHNSIEYHSDGTKLYIFWLLHQTTTYRRLSIISIMLYIFWLLHQTTTSQHGDFNKFELYIFWLLHQTTT